MPISKWKDCNCIVHDGPHWLHEDRLWHEKNQELLRLAQRSAPLSANLLYTEFCRAELRRLGEKERQMKKMGWDEIPAELVR